MASSKKGKNIGRAGDGLKYLGFRDDGKKWWQARLYYRDPHTGAKRETLETFQADSKPLASLKRAEILDTLRSGKLLECKRFCEVAALYVESRVTHASKTTAKSFERTLNAQFAQRRLDSITARELQAFLDGLRIVSVNNVRNALVGIFQLAADKHYISVNTARLTQRRPAPPVAVNEHGEVADAPVQALTPELVAMLFDYLELNEPDLYPLVYLQYIIGCRYSEVAALRRDHIDIDRGIVEIRRGQYLGEVGPPKAKEARVAGLPLEARALIKAHLTRMQSEQWPGWQDLVFPRPLTTRARSYDFWNSATVRSKLRRAFVALGIEVKGATHVARHTMITIADEIPRSELLLRKVVGHRSKAVHEGYKHPPEARVVRLAERIGKRLTGSRSQTGTGTTTGTSRQSDENGT